MTANALAVLRADDHLSLSSVSCFVRCPAQYQHRYLLGTAAAHRSAPLAFGSAIHEALAAFYTSLRSSAELGLPELQAAFDEAWSQEMKRTPPVLFDRDDTPDTVRERGKELLAAFHAQAPRPYRVVGVEEAFAVELPEIEGVRLVGVFDAIVQERDGSYRILEHKTARRRWTQQRLDHDLQPTLYAAAAPLMGLGPAPVTLQILLSQKQPTLECHELSRCSSDYRDLLATLVGVRRSIAAKAFFPRRDWQCGSCPFAGPCLAG
jgi:putative RecB family exonuclease